MTSSHAHHICALRALLGEKAILDGPDAHAYEHGARFDIGKAAFVIRPGSTAETSSAVSYCVKHGIHLVPQSGNTGVVSGSTPDGSGTQAILSLDRLAKKLEIDADNRTVTIDAGVLLSDLNAALEPHGLFFPIDVGSDPRLGGMISTNTGGARYLKYGDVRRNTLGLTVVLADENGTILDLKTGVRKNNVGVDWKQMFIGTSGAFGIVTECVLNVERLPQQTAAALLVPSRMDGVLPLLRAIETRCGADLSAFEGISRNAVEATLAHVSSVKNPFQNAIVPEYVVLAELTRTSSPREGEPSLDSVLEQVLAEIWEDEPELLSDALLGPPREMWALRHAVSEGVKLMGKLVAFDLSFRRGEVITFCQHMKSVIAARYEDVVVCDFGHVGDGGVHFNVVALPNSAAAKDPDFENEMREFVYDIVVRDFRGSFSGEHGIGRKNQVFYDRFTNDAVKSLAQGLKALTSPGGLGVARFG